MASASATTQIKVAISYSWKEEREGKNAGAVGTFCEKLTTAGASVVRDIDQVKRGESLSKFMQSIGASDFICVFLSDAYLKSPNCMYELLIAWQRSKDNSDEFRKRVKVWVMPGSVSIHTLENRLQYTAYWQSERDRVSPLIEKFVLSGLAATSLETFRLIAQFAEHVNEMLDFFADSLSPSSVEEFQQWIESHIGIVPAQSLDQQIAAVYANTAKEIEKLVNDNERLQQFLLRASPGIVINIGGHWTLADSVRRGGIDLCPTLEGISTEMRQFSEALPSDWAMLRQLTGGLITLAVNPQWVLEQREAIKKTVEYPGWREEVPFQENQTAFLLPVLSAALADGFVRLEKVFGVPDNTPDPPAVFKGVLKPDKEVELMLHFIRLVLGQSVKIDPTNASEINEAFENTRDVCRFAFEKKKEPQCLSKEAYRQLVSIIRDQLKLEHILLLFPKRDGGVRDVLTDPIALFSHAFEIFSAIKLKVAE